MDKKYYILIGVLVVVGLAAGGYFYWKGQGADSGDSLQPTSTPPLKLNLDFLDNPRAKSLQKHGRYPIEKGRYGRSNPFLPY